jgi:Histidine kinase/Bacterial regulatory proteins, luxR family
LSRSRARIVAAQDTERRRIERDLHDGAQQHVVALITKLRLARNQLARAERSTEEVLGELQADARNCLPTCATLAHGIHPPVLSDRGLVAAIEARADRLPVDIVVRAEPALREQRLGQDVEVAAYVTVCEALTNTADPSTSRATRAQARASAPSFPSKHPMSDRLRIVIAEDNYLVREGTRRLLEDSGEVEVLAAVGDGKQLRDAVRPAVPGRGPHRHPHATKPPHGRHRRRARDPSRNTPASASPCYPSTPTKATPSPCSATAPPAWPICSRTGSAIAQGKTNVGIEQALHLSTSTVEKHVNSIFGRLGLTEEPVYRRVAAVLTFLRRTPTA